MCLPQENGEDVKNLLVLGRGRHLNLDEMRARGNPLL